MAELGILSDFSATSVLEVGALTLGGQSLVGADPWLFWQLWLSLVCCFRGLCAFGCKPSFGESPTVLDLHRLLRMWVDSLSIQTLR